MDAHGCTIVNAHVPREITTEYRACACVCVSVLMCASRARVCNVLEDTVTYAPSDGGGTKEQWKGGGGGGGGKDARWKDVCACAISE